MTRAIRFLEEKGLAFEVVEYDHLEKGALFASQAIGMPVERTIKTLIVELSNKGFSAILIPGNKTLSLKRLAKRAGSKKAAMASPRVAERLTGYLVGGISPFAMRRSIPVAIDKALLDHPTVAVNGGKRGVMLIMQPEDVVKGTKAEPVEF